MMTAIAKIQHGTDFKSIERDDEHFINGFREHLTDKDVSHVFLKAPTAYDFGPKVTVTSHQLDKNGNPIPQERQERWYEYYVNRCDDWIDSTVVFKALNYFAQKTTAFALWWAYESIAKDEGGFYKLARRNKWVTEDELGFFTDSLNRYDIDGHGRHVEDPQDDYLRPKMSLLQAQTFLAQRLLKPWLIKKRELFKLAEGEAIAKSLFDKLNI